MQADTIAGPARSGFDGAPLDGFVAALRGDAAGGAIPGAVVLVSLRGHVVRHEAVGCEQASVAMQPDSVFRIAAAGKPSIADVLRGPRRGGLHLRG